MAKGKRTLLYVLLGIVLFFVLAFGVVLFMGWRWYSSHRDAAQEQVAKVEAAGESLEITHYVPETLPPEQNGADELQQAMDLLRAAQVSVAYELAEVNCEPGEEHEEGVVFTDIDGADSTQRVANLIQECENQGVFEKLENALATDGIVFDLDYSNPVAMKMSHLTHLREFSRLLAADARLAAAQGDPARYGKRVRQGFELISKVQDEPTLISCLVSLAMSNIAVSAVELDGRTFETGLSQLDDGQLEAVQKVVGALDLKAMFERAMLSERCFGNFIFDKMLTDPDYLNEIAGDMRQARSHIPSFLMKFLLSADREYYLEKMAHYVELAEKPYYEVREQLEGADAQDRPKFAFISALVLPALSNAFTRSTECLARLRCTNIALELLKASNRSRLGSTEDLLDLTGFEEERLTDPFTGERLKAVLRKADDGGALLVVYSVGENASDDGGDLTKRETSPTPDIGIELAVGK
ncbi:MAG: hypothetical protein U5N86_00845 [Planctomycetota bacterium]|nr:hypothetical protein [Planctomycetota bacterium]